MRTYGRGRGRISSLPDADATCMRTSGRGRGRISSLPDADATCIYTSLIASRAVGVGVGVVVGVGVGVRVGVGWRMSVLYSIVGVADNAA